MDSLIREAAAKIAPLEKLVVLSGAGASRESGIPTFREAQTGLWAKYNPEDLATPEGFRSDPELVWQWYDWRRTKLAEVSPNPGHFAISAFEEIGLEVPVVTQNVDGLHQKAGSTDVIELHGSISRFKCFDSGHPVADVPLGLTKPPLCHCGSQTRPDVVWFGESLSSACLNRGLAECEGAEVLIVVGTSGIVQPAASLPVAGLMKGAFLIEVNPEETPLTSSCQLFFKAPGGEVLPLLLDAVKALRH